MVLGAENVLFKVMGGYTPARFNPNASATKVAKPAVTPTEYGVGKADFAKYDCYRSPDMSGVAGDKFDMMM